MVIGTKIHTIEDLLVQFQYSYSNRDAKKFLSLFDANNPHTMLWGTGQDEVRFGLHEIAQQIKRDWEQSEAAELTQYRILAKDTQGSVSIVAADWSMTVHIRKERYDYHPLRSTFVLRLIGARWLIQHAHWSLPADQEVGRSFPDI